MARLPNNQPRREADDRASGTYDERAVQLASTFRSKWLPDSNWIAH
jgi:hypothetical protein